MMERRKNLNDKFGFVDSMKIKDFIDYEQPNEYIVESDRYNSKYSTPVLTAGQSFILGYTNESKGIYKKGPCIIFDDFTTSVHYVDFPFKVKSSAMKILTTKSNTDLRYCYYLLLSLSKMPPNHKRQWISTTSEKTHELPSMDKQIAIVKQLDLISDTIAIYTNQIENLDNLVKARFVEMFGEPVNNPKKFEKRSLKDTCKIVTGNTPSRAVEEYYGDFVEWIKTDNIISGEINPTRAVEYLSEEGMKVGRVVEEDAILMACIAGSIASIGRVCVTDRTVAFNQQINAIVPYDYNQLFLYVLLQISKDYLIEDVSMSLKGILSKSKLEEKEFIVPPLELQNQFADFVRQVDKSREAVKKSLEKTQQLYDSLMQEYFG